MLGDFYTLFDYCVFVCNSISKCVWHQQFSVLTFFHKIMIIFVPHMFLFCVCCYLL
jgi:hypothetical protein